MPTRARRKILDIWNRLLIGECSTFAIVEDLEAQYPANIQGFGLSVFVRDEFVEEFLSSPRPYVSTIFYEQVARERIVLNPEQLSSLNSTVGINVLVLHFGLRNPDLDNPLTSQVLAAGGEAFQFFHGGYFIKLILNEEFGRQHARYMEQGGFRLVRDFHGERPELFTGLPEEEHPYLFALRREWVQRGAVHPLSEMFYRSAPRLQFATSERKVLEGALLNESDAAIAARLGVSIDTIKKTWRSIFLRTAEVLPTLIPRDDRMAPESRGQEKRRYIVEYVRLHLEELRPFESSMEAVQEVALAKPSTK